MGKKVDAPLSKDPLTHPQAEAQQAALHAAEDDDTKEQDTKMMYPVECVGPGPISFAELQAREKAIEVSEMADYFPAMVTRIMSRPDIEDKNEAVRKLAVEFIGIVNDMLPQEQSKEVTKEKDDQPLSKEAHYKAVEVDATQAIDEDFQDGCPRCEFGEIELMKGLEKCPYCWGEL